MDKTSQSLARAFMVDQLREMQQADGQLSNAYVAQVAKSLGCSSRTLRRWIAEGMPSGGNRRPVELSEEELVTYFRCGGSVSAMCRDLEQRGELRRHRTTMGRALDVQLDPAQRAFAKQGHKGRRAASVYLTREEQPRNRVWELDHVMLDIEVAPTRGKKLLRPWATFAVDAGTRAICGLSISERPTAADVIACIKQGVRSDQSLGPVNGAPDCMVWDNGKEFLSDAVSQVVSQLGTLPAPLPSYTPHLKGKVERFNRTINQELLIGLPYYTGGARDKRERLYGPGEHLGYEELVQRVLAWVRHYNYKRPHSALNGRTPAEAWAQDPARLRTFTDEQLHWMALPSKRVKVTNKGVQLLKHHYVWPSANDYMGHWVELRYMPHDERSVDVYFKGKFVATASPANALNAEETKAFLAAREESRKRASDLRRKASREERARQIDSATAGRTVRLSPQNGEVELAPVIAIDRDQAERELLARDGIKVDPNAGLTGLNQPWEFEDVSPSALAGEPGGAA